MGLKFKLVALLLTIMSLATTALAVVVVKRDVPPPWM
jgi:hypothetical protein